MGWETNSGDSLGLISVEWENRVNRMLVEFVQWKDDGDLLVMSKITISHLFTKRFMEEPLPLVKGHV